MGLELAGKLLRFILYLAIFGPFGRGNEIFYTSGFKVHFSGLVDISTATLT